MNFRIDEGHHHAYSEKPDSEFLDLLDNQNFHFQVYFFYIFYSFLGVNQ